MITNVYSLYDRAVAVYGRPIFSPATGGVLRELKDAVNGGQDNISKHSQDFDLYELGTFDDVLGSFVLYAKPRLIVNCGALKDVPTHPSDSAPQGAAGAGSSGNGAASSVFPRGIDL